MTKTSHKVLLTGGPGRQGKAFYGPFTPSEFDLVPVEKPGDAEDMAENLQEIEFAYGIPPMDWLDLMPRLRLIQFQGTGYSEPHLLAARARGVPVAITPEGTCLGVAEHTILLILALYKHLVEAHQAMQEGKWPHAELRGQSFFFYGKVLGIVGLGRIGREVVQRARGFLPQRVVYYDLYRKTPEEEAALGVEYLGLDELLHISDIVTLHVFLSDQSRGLIGERELSLMRPSAIFINTSRGAVVDEQALYRALRDKKIWGAGVDAWTEEPTAPDNPIRRLENVVCTPHMATGTADADRIKYQAAIRNFQRVLRGEQPINVVEKLYSELPVP